MWELFKNWIFDVISWFYSWCGDWGLAILLVTIIFRIIMTPLMHKQQKSSWVMQKMQPEMQRIKERFPDDKQRQTEEMQKIYANNKYNPVIGCIPMIIQIPIFMALFQVLSELGQRIEDTSSYCFYGIVPNLVLTPGEAFGNGFMSFLPYLILMLIFAFATFIPTYLSAKDNPSNAGMMRTMAIVMSLMMLWISWSSPAGVLLFWGASSLLALLQMRISRTIFKKQDEKAEAEEYEKVKPVEVNVTRTVKKKRQHKSR